MSSNNTTNVCSDVNLPLAVHGSLFTALCLILTLAFLEKRKKLWLDCWDGRPGIIIPINLLDDYENRWVYACCFGAIINVIATLFYTPDAFQNVDQTYTTLILAILYSAEVCIAFYPFFACFLTSYKMVGAICGGIYSGTWFLLVFVISVECAVSGLRAPFSVIALQGPAVVCLAVITCRYIKITYTCWKRHEYTKVEKPLKKVAEKFQIDFVEYAINRHKQVSDDSETSGFKAKLKRFVTTHIWEKKPHFKFSSRIICTMVVAGLITYQLSLVWFYFSALSSHTMRVFVNENGDKYNMTEVADVTIKLYAGFVYTIGILSVLIMTLDIFLILAKYRTNLIQLYRGDYSFLPQGYKSSPADKMRWCMMFPGYQIAYKLVGLTIMISTLTILMGIVIVIVAVVVQFDVFLDAFKIIAAIFFISLIRLPGAISLLLWLTQQSMCHWLFLQDRINNKDEQKPLALQNRRFYHIVNYFFFIANIPIGFYSVLGRIGRSLFWGLVFLGRIDRCVLPPGFETMDYGYMSYIGMLFVEHTHNNPILRVFCQHLLWTKSSTNEPSLPGSFTNINYQTGEPQEQMNNFASSYQSHHRIKSRWFLFLTLANNPNLIPLRKHHIESQERVELESSNMVLDILKTGVQGALGVNEHTENATRQVSPDLQEIVAKQLQENKKRQLQTNHAQNEESDSAGHDSSS